MKEFTVRQARERAGLTQQQLAEAAGVDQTTISDLETGRHRNPRLNTIQALAKALGISPVQLRFSEPQPSDSVVEATDKVGHDAPSPVGDRRRTADRRTHGFRRRSNREKGFPDRRRSARR